MPEGGAAPRLYLVGEASERQKAAGQQRALDAAGFIALRDFRMKFATPAYL
jgi:hypothetical protein